MKKFFMICIVMMCMAMTAVACSDKEKDDPKGDVEISRLAGEWRCSEVDVLDIRMDMDGMEMPEYVLDMIRTHIEDQMMYEKVVIDPKNVKLDGKVLIFKDSGIKWSITSISDDVLSVVYEVMQDYQSVTMNIKIAAKYVRED